MTRIPLPDFLTALPRRTVPAVLLTMAMAISAVAIGAQVNPTEGPASTDPSAELAAGGLPSPDAQPGASSTAGGSPVPSAATGSDTETASTTWDSDISTPLMGAGGRNVVLVSNRHDERLRVRGAVQLSSVNAPRVSPENLAQAWASCTDCETLAVALQVNLIPRGTQLAAPRNAAVAVNYGCTRCTTVARAFQYTLSVDDPTNVPRDVRALVVAMNQELRTLGSDPELTLDAAEARIDAVIGQFVELAESLDDERAATTAQTTPGAGETPETSPALQTDGSQPTVTSTPAPSADPASQSPEATAAPSPDPSLTPTPSPATRTPTPTPTPTPTSTDVPDG